MIAPEDRPAKWWDKRKLDQALLRLIGPAPSRGNPATRPVMISDVTVPDGPAPGAPRGNDDLDQ